MNADVHTLTGAYALDALDDDEERAEFERHLVDCPDCAREVAELRSTANRLGLAVAERPPDVVRLRVLDEIRRTPQEAPGTVIPLARRARRRGVPRWVTTVTAAAAVVALALAGTFGVFAVRAQHELGETQEQLAAAAADYAPVARVLGQPDARSVTATATGGGNGTVVTSRRLDEAVFLAFHLPAAQPGRTYQAWAIGPSGAKSLGLLVAAGADSTAPVVLGSLGGVRNVGVTVEPAGGSRQPTTTPLLLIPV